jgi:hypothetical protein
VYKPLVTKFDASKVHSEGTSAKVGSSGTGAGGLVAAGVISGLADIANGFINAQRTKNAYKFNAAMQQVQGRMIKLKAREEIKDIRAKALSLFSTQQARYAKAGVAMTGSPLEVMHESIKNAELDAIFTQINADYAAATGETQAGIYRAAGKSAGIDAYTNAMKTILNMANKAYTRG